MPLVIPVRMHFSAQDLWFNPASSGAGAGDHVVVTTERGTEFGLATAEPFKAPKEEIHGELKPVLRVATERDLARAEDLARKGDEAMPVFRELIKAQGLDMKPVGVEFLFGGEKAVFYFAAEERIDFRELVRELAGRFHTRVDMRQIGVRDEVRLVGGYAPCGQELCCARFSGKFEPVSIRMAKEQDLPLNSAKISGMCGRLMCCLRYEFEAYKDFKTRAPKRNALIDTPLGKAKIVEYNTPRETITMRLENGKSFTVPLSEMSCSEGCRKRCEQQGSPLRPDTVSREALEALGTAEIMAQLADLDRQANPEAYELDSSLLSPRARRSAKADTASGASAGTTRRARGSSGSGAGAGASAGTSGKAGAAKSAEGGAKARGAEGPEEGGRGERPSARKGMRPRRQNGGRTGAEQQAGSGQAPGEKARGGQAGRQAGASLTPRGRSQTTGGGAAAGRQAEGAEGRQQPQKRVRRHHTVSEDARPAGGGSTGAQPGSRAGRERDERDAGRAGATRQGTPTPRRTHGEGAGAGRETDAREAGTTRVRRQHGPARTDGAQGQPAGAGATPRQRRKQAGGGQGGTGGTGDAGQGQSQGQGQGGSPRRKRRPGDKGGAAGAGGASAS